MGLRDHFPVIDRAVDRIGYWIGLLVILWLAMTWLFHEIAAVAAFGWAAIVVAAIIGTAIVAASVGALLAGWRYFHPLPQSKRPKIKKGPLADVDGEDHDRLMEFVFSTLRPACWHMIRLQEKVLDEIEGRPQLKELAKNGMYAGHQEFKSILNRLAEHDTSPPMAMTLLELIEAASRMENRVYRDFGMQLHAFTEAARIDPQSHRATAAEWKSWQQAHESLVEAYDKIKGMSVYDTRKYGEGLPSLYRPTKRSRWGDVADFIYDPN